MTEKRRFIDLLPTIHQTETLKKFFGTTVDHAFQPGRAETLTGYIGSKPSYYDSAIDFYVQERTKERQAYQLDPAMLSKASSGEISHLLFYEDFVRYISLNGGNVDDHNRLFSDEYYTWCPPIDVDKFMNFGQYLWFGDRPDLIPIAKLSAPREVYTGDGEKQLYALPPVIPGLTAADEKVFVFVDGRLVTDVVRSGNTLVICSTPAAGAEVTIFRYGDLRHVLHRNSKMALDPFGFSGNLTSGMVVNIDDATNIFHGFDTQAYDFSLATDENVLWDAYRYPSDLTQINFFVDGVGDGAIFTPTDLKPNFKIDYSTIDRRSLDRNPWSRSNYWIHREALLWSGIDFSARVATRPIIEFRANIQLHEYGTRRRRDIDVVFSRNPIFSPWSRDVDLDLEISNWDVYGFDTQPIDGRGYEEISIDSVIGRPPGTVFGDGGRRVSNDHRILITKQGETFSNRIMTAARAGAQNVLLLYPEGTVVEGDIVAVRERGPVPFDTTTLEELPWAFDFNPVEYYFDGNRWRLAQRKGLDPLFALFTDEGTPHHRITPSFGGNRVFAYADGDGAFDRETQRRLRYDKNGKIVFENEQATRVTAGVCGLQRVRFYDTNTLDDAWFKAEGKTTQTLDDEVYSTPLNLQANPDNEEVAFATQNELLEHFANLIASQDRFAGSQFASNNYRDLAKDYARGLRIIQSRSPLLRAMLLASDTRFDYFDAVRYAEKEYVRYRNKLIQQIDEIVRSGALTEDDGVEDWIVELKRRLKIAKTNEFPFAFNRIGGGNDFIPPTGAALGILPNYAPRLDLERINGVSRFFIIGHDGSQTPTFGDYRDAIILAFEQSIYDAIPDNLVGANNEHFDWYDFDEGKFRRKTDTNGRYSREEINEIFEPIFLQWAARQRLNTRENNTYSEDDPFTWNYSRLQDHDGEPVPGHWRAMYRWFFDTERPHEAPWEMLGFHEEPDWWVRRYGGAPFSRSNLVMWRDIEAGFIAEGPRQGTDVRFARPGLMNILPVANDGTLLDPVTANIVVGVPGRVSAERVWLFGDGGPVENTWRKSASFSFAKAQACFLMRPSHWLEFGWEREHRSIASDGTAINTRTGNRPRARQSVIHGENLMPEVHGCYATPLPYYSLHGIQQWIVDLMVSRAQSPSILGRAVRGLGVQLAHRMGGFTDKRNLRVFADNLGILPEEDVTVKYHVSQPFRVSRYSGLIITWDGTGWLIDGEEREEEFTVIPGDPTGRTLNISLGEDPVIFEWGPNIFYNVGILVAYEGSIYRCVRSHTSTSRFERDFWNPQPQAVVNSPRVTVFEDGEDRTEKVVYTTKYRTVQAVAEFIRNYARWLEAEGWVFDGIDPDTGEVEDWEYAIRAFLRWTQTRWEPGAFIVLSPGARQLKFIAQHGTTFNLEEVANGYYGLIDRFGQPIQRRTTFVSRLDEETKIIAVNDNLFAARMRIGEIEHVLVFSNQTIFNDTIYNPLLNLRQPRLRLIGLRSSHWAGRRDAPGYVIENDRIYPDYERTARNMRDLFEVEGSEDRRLRDHSRHLIGYQARPYLDNLLLSETQQFEFYQGMIQSKGAIGSFDKLIRSRLIGEPRDLRFLEEWAYKIADYGRDAIKHRVSFTLRREDVRFNPQIIDFSGEPSSERRIFSPTSYVEKPGVSDIFELNLSAPPEDNRGFDVNPYDIKAWDINRWRHKQPGKRQKLPDAGYVRLGETGFLAKDYLSLDQIDGAAITEVLVEEGMRVWIYDRGDASFDVLRATELVQRVTDVRLVNRFGTEGIATFDQNHRLQSIHVGRLVAVVDGGRSHFLVITRVIDARRIGVVMATGGEIPVFAREAGAPTYYMQSVRFPDIETFERDRDLIPFRDGELAYVDRAPDNWKVYVRSGSAWRIHREYSPTLNSDRLRNIAVYDAQTHIDAELKSVEPTLLADVAIIDPNNGRIHPLAERELSYIQDNDPAVYRDAAQRWGSEQLGQLWWNVGSARFLLNTTDVMGVSASRDEAELTYRDTTWAAPAPGSEIEVYEWTRSTRAPFDQLSIAKEEYDPRTQTTVLVHYFWSLNPTAIPETAGRRLSASYVAQLIENPTATGMPWVAPLTSDKMIVSGMEQFLNDETSVLRFDVARTDDPIDHEEWQILQRETPLPQDLWRSMLISLMDRDQKPSDVSLFGEDRHEVLRARSAFVEALNNIVSRKSLSQSLDLRAAIERIETPIFEVLSWTRAGREVVEPPFASFDFEIRGGGKIEDRVADDTLITAMTGISWEIPEFESLWRNYVRVNRPRFLMRHKEPTHESWTIWEFDVDDVQFANNRPVKVSRFYDARVDNLLTYREQNIFFSSGVRVLIENDDRYGGLWTCSIYDPTNPAADEEGLVLVSIQTMRASDFIERTTWFADNVDPTRPPIVSYPTIAARNRAEAPPNNLFVRIADDGAGAWVWTSFDEVWNVVARGDSGFTISSFDGEPLLDLTDVSPASVADRDGSLELLAIGEALYDLLEVEEIYDLFFSMVRYAYARNESVPWIFKTSFLSIAGLNEILRQTPIQRYDNTQNLIDYIEEVKPYRVRLRDFARTLTTEFDQANVRVLDFDKPIYFDPALGRNRRLDPNRPADLAIITSTEPYKFWFAQISAETNLLRKVKVKINFDRVDIDALTVSSYGYDILPHDIVGWDLGDDRLDGGSALARVLASQRDWVGLDDPYNDALYRKLFKGVTIDGGSFYETEAEFFSDYDVTPHAMHPYDSVIWNEEDFPIENEEDGRMLLEHGGIVDPAYTAPGAEECARTRTNDCVSVKTTHMQPRSGLLSKVTYLRQDEYEIGGTITLPLPMIPQSRDAVAIFLNGIRAVEGVDYIVSHFAATATIDIPAWRATTFDNNTTTFGTTRFDDLLIMARCFGHASLANIAFQDYFVGDGTNDTFFIGSYDSGVTVTVTVDGIFTNDYSIVGDSIVFATPPVDDADILVTVYAPEPNGTSDFDVLAWDTVAFDADFTNYDVEVRVIKTPITYDPSETWVLPDVRTTALPQFVEVIVEQNGIALRPPFVRKGRLDAVNTTLPFTTVSNVANLRMFVGDQEITPDVHIGTLASAPASAPIVIDGQTIRWNAAAGQSFESITFVLYENHTFDVASQELTFTAAVSDPMPPTVVTTFKNADTTAFEMQTYHRNTTGVYALATRLTNAEMVMVWINGRQIAPTYDYSLDLAGTAVVIHRHLEPNDFITMVSLTGETAEPVFSSRQASRFPTGSMMGRNVEIGSFDTTPFDEVANDTTIPGPTFEMDTYDIIDRSRIGLVLAQPFARTDQEIHVAIRSDRSPLVYKRSITKPQDGPGIVWIGDERIEFFDIETTATGFVLRQLRRGTRGTSIGRDQRSSHFFTPDGSTTEYEIPAISNRPVILHWLQTEEDISDWDREAFDTVAHDKITQQEVYTGQNQALGEVSHYTVSVSGGTMTVTFEQPPMWPFVIHQKAETGYPIGTLVEPLQQRTSLLDNLKENK